MKISLRQLIISLASLMLAVVLVVFIAGRGAEIGSQALVVRALVLALSITAGLIAIYPIVPGFSGRPAAFAMAICVPAIVPAFVYYLMVLPSQASEGFSASQSRSELITDGSSNGIVEVGFSYPIYTPTLTIRNNGLYTEQVNVFLRMIDSGGSIALFRAVRRQVPGVALSVESSVRGLLSERDGVLFLPLAIAPLQEVTGQLVFIISNLNDGTSFTDALSSAYQAHFELRDPASGALLFEFPLEHI
ncbi:MAG: hypothetical protein ACI95C_000957 [Pseudohongiellaceae bacterium]|jgi:hypothetical protein